MLTKVEIGCGALSLACFAAALDAWLGGGAVDFLVDLCLGDTSAVPPKIDGMPMPDGGHGTHASLFLAAGLAALGFGLTSSELGPMLGTSEIPRTEGRARRRLIAAIIYVARSCDTALPRHVAEAFREVTGEMLPKGEVAKAVEYMRSQRAASIERILGRVTDDDEKRRILAATSHIWIAHGADSERATRAIERIASAMSLEGNDINAALDANRIIDASLVMKNVEVFARKTLSRAATEAQRISTRIRGIG